MGELADLAHRRVGLLQQHRQEPAGGLRVGLNQLGRGLHGHPDRREPGAEAVVEVPAGPASLVLDARDEALPRRSQLQRQAQCVQGGADRHREVVEQPVVGRGEGVVGARGDEQPADAVPRVRQFPDGERGLAAGVRPSPRLAGHRHAVAGSQLHPHPGGTQCRRRRGRERGEHAVGSGRRTGHLLGDADERGVRLRPVAEQTTGDDVLQPAP